MTIFNVLKRTSFNSSQAIQLVVLSLMAFNIGCSDSSGGAKRNARNLFNLDIRANQCGVHIKKSFTSQPALCEYIAYEARTNSCLHYELQREYSRYNCNVANYNGHVNVNIPPTYNPVSNQPIIHQPPTQDDTYWQDLDAMYSSILDYYTLDSTGCVAHIKGTDDQILLCEDGPRGTDKDQEWVYQTPERPVVPRTPEKDEPITGSLNTPSQSGSTLNRPSQSSSGGSTTPSAPAQTNTPSAPATSPTGTNPTPSNPPASNAGQKLDHNLISYNARSFQYNEVSTDRLPVLVITAVSDARSPINNLRYNSADKILELEFTNLTTTCPVGAKLTSNGNNIILGLYTKAGSSDQEKTACKNLFDSLSTATGFDIQFSEPLVMSNGERQNVPFKFVNQ